MSTPSHTDSVVSVEYRGRVAVLTICNEKKLNALSQLQYYDLSHKLREVAKHEEVFVTVILGKGRFFSAGADVTVSSSSSSSSSDGDDNASETRRQWLQFLALNLNIVDAFASHPKILVVGLNGPVIGLSAALVSHADFIYCTPGTFLLTPFSSLGLVAEGGASRALVRRLGPARANEALIMSKKLAAPELERCGFVNAVFDVEPGERDERGRDRFRELVLKEVDERLGEHLVGESLIGIKKLIRGTDKDVVDLANVREVFDGLERMVTGVPQEEIRKIASGKKRHKL